MIDIKPYILEKSSVNGFDFYKYLHIIGGSGYDADKRKRGLGGNFDFIIFYAEPNKTEIIDKCARIFCLENNIPFGEGKTIEQAYLNWLQLNTTNNHI